MQRFDLKSRAAAYSIPGEVILQVKQPVTLTVLIIDLCDGRIGSPGVQDDEQPFSRCCWLVSLLVGWSGRQMEGQLIFC